MKQPIVYIVANRRNGTPYRRHSNLLQRVDPTCCSVSTSTAQA